MRIMKCKKKIVLILVACLFVSIGTLKSQSFFEKNIEYIKGREAGECIEFWRVEATRITLMNDYLAVCALMDEYTYKLESSEDKKAFNSIAWNILVILAIRGFNSFDVTNSITVCDLAEIRKNVSIEKSLMYKYLSQEDKQEVTAKFKKLFNAMKRYH